MGNIGGENVGSNRLVPHTVNTVDLALYVDLPHTVLPESSLVGILFSVLSRQLH